MSNEYPENSLYESIEDHVEQIVIDNQSSDSEIDSSDLEDITDDIENQGALCEFCQHPNAAKKFVKKQLYNGVRFCNKFCANRYHLKQTASLEENETNPMAGNKNAKKKSVGQRKKQQWGKSRQRGGEKQQEPEKRRVLKPKLKTASTGNKFIFHLTIIYILLIIFPTYFFRSIFLHDT